MMLTVSLLYGDNFLRKSIYEQILSLKLKNFKPISIIDETATISSYSSIEMAVT